MSKHVEEADHASRPGESLRINGPRQDGSLTAANYRKKPVEVEAMLLTDENYKTVAQWCGGRCGLHSGVLIETPEGVMKASVGDYVIRGVAGEFYPCKPDIFHTTYEAVD